MSGTIITKGQCRAARALAEVGLEVLARKAGLPAEAIAGFEKGQRVPGPAELEALRSALEDLGAVFIPENGGGVGVRLKFSRQVSRRVSNWESEGGSVADDVP